MLVYYFPFLPIFFLSCFMDFILLWFVIADVLTYFSVASTSLQVFSRVILNSSWQIFRENKLCLCTGICHVQTTEANSLAIFTSSSMCYFCGNSLSPKIVCLRLCPQNYFSTTLNIKVLVEKKHYAVLTKGSVVLD